MKNILFIFLFITCAAFAQKEQKQDSIVYEYNARWYNPSFCGCPPGKKDSLQVVKDTLKVEPITFNRRNYKSTKYVKTKKPLRKREWF